MPYNMHSDKISRAGFKRWDIGLNAKRWKDKFVSARRRKARVREAPYVRGFSIHEGER